MHQAKTDLHQVQILHVVGMDLHQMQVFVLSFPFCLGVEVNTIILAITMMKIIIKIPAFILSDASYFPFLFFPLVVDDPASAFATSCCSFS